MKIHIPILLVLHLAGIAGAQPQFIPGLMRGSQSDFDVNHLVGIMVEFEQETIDDPTTSGDGTFLLDTPADVQERCSGFLVDPPPHNQLYFESQLTALANYYYSVSSGNLDISTQVLPSVYTVDHPMVFYSADDTQLGALFVEAVTLATTDLAEVLTPNSVIVLFHAGIGQDFSFPFFDPTPLDLPSAFIDAEMLTGLTPPQINGMVIDRGVLIPETQNHIYYPAIEDIYPGSDEYCDYQIGLTGTFAFLLGYALGLPPQFNTETGDAGVGIFGLMDHGSNNGRGVLPALPTAWTRLIKNWTDSTAPPAEGLVDIPQVGQQPQGGAEDFILRIDIGQNEYFLIENRNNWVRDTLSIDVLRELATGDPYNPGRFFDTILEEMTDEQIFIDPETNVILGFDRYDYGLPGSGLLIWHINEPDPDDYFSGINNDSTAKAIHLEEADGAVDIGWPNLALFADPSIGWLWDMWFSGNEGWFVANPGEDMANEAGLLRFTHDTMPSSRSRNGGNSLVQLSEIGDPGPVMTAVFQQTITETAYNPITGEDVILFQVNQIELPGTAQILGNGLDDNGNGVIYFAADDQLVTLSASDTLTIPWNNPLPRILYRPECDTAYIPFDESDLKFLDSTCSLDYGALIPEGFITGSDIESAPMAHALGDLDFDGLDEQLAYRVGKLTAVNENGVSCNGFPVQGNFQGIPLVAGVLPEDGPEIICRDGNSIVVLSSSGERLLELSSFAPDIPLSLIPNWDVGKAALVDGHRLLIFDNEPEYNYWLNPHGRPSNEPLVSGSHENEPTTITGLDKGKVYNYPNPVSDGQTTFRFYTGSSVTQVDIKIYDAAGYKVDEIRTSQIIPNSYNELLWHTDHLDSGLYMAEVKPNTGDAALVNVVILR